MDMIKPQKWTPTALKYANGCIRRYEKFISQSPIEVDVVEFKEGTEAHKKIESYLLTKDAKYIASFSDAVKRDLDLILSYGGTLKTELQLSSDNIEGIADIVIELENKWIVIDIKSRFDADIEKEDLWQLYLYLYLLQLQKQKPEALIGILACWNSYNPLVLQHAEFVKIEELEKYVNSIIKHAERVIEHGRINTAYCRYCNYILSCEYSNKEVNSIEDIARQYIHLKSLILSYEQQLRTHVELTGKNIIVDGMEIGMHVRNKTTINEEILKQVVTSNNIELSLIYKPNITAIKKLSKKYEDLANCINIEQDYEFSVKKLKE